MCSEEVKDIPCREYRPVVLIAQFDSDTLDKLAVASEYFDKYEFVLASTGVEVIDQVNDNCFDAVVLGLKFPDITGATLAYLIHVFDPLISLAFLTNYRSDILVSTASNLNCQFWDKDLEMENMPVLCEKIHELAVKMPCGNSERMVTREFTLERRELYSRYRKLEVPKSIAEVIDRRR